MRLGYKPQSVLSYALGDWLLFSESHLIERNIAARVSPRRFGLYPPNIALTFLLVTKAVCLMCSYVEIRHEGLACYLI